MKKWMMLFFCMIFAVSVASAGPVVVDMRTPDGKADPLSMKYAAAIWDGLEGDPIFIPVIQGEDMPRFIVEIDVAERPDNKEEFQYSVQLLVDLDGSNKETLLSRLDGVGKKSDLAKNGKKMADDIKANLKKQEAEMATLQKYTE